MKSLASILAVVVLAACGADTMGTAATAAALKKQEAEQGRKTMERAQQRIKDATDQMQEAARRSAEASEGN